MQYFNIMHVTHSISNRNQLGKTFSKKCIDFFLKKIYAFSALDPIYHQTERHQSQNLIHKLARIYSSRAPHPQAVGNSLLSQSRNPPNKLVTKVRAT